MALYGLPQGLTSSLVPRPSAESSWRGTAGPPPGTWVSNTLGVPGTYKPWPLSLLQPALSPHSLDCSQHPPLASWLAEHQQLGEPFHFVSFVFLK